MNVSEHTARVFDTDLIKLTQLVAQMGGLAQKQITDSIDALTRRDIGLARQVIAADASVDALQIEARALQSRVSGVVHHPLHGILPQIMVPLITIIIKSLKKSPAAAKASAPEKE